MQDTARKKACIEASQEQNKVKQSKREGEVWQASGSHSKLMVSVCLQRGK